MTAQQRQILDIAFRLGADPREVELAVALARTGRVDLLIAVSAQRLTVRAALKAARSTTQPITQGGRRLSKHLSRKCRR
jgi:hypothetical protein